MSKRSDLWHQAQVCLTLARVAGDPVLKELYENMAVEFAHTAAREPDFDDVENLDTTTGRWPSLNTQ